jgi:hypothetical protein
MILRTAGECGKFLSSVVDENWAATPIPGMDWTVARAVAHISDCLLWFSTDLAAGDRELSTMEMHVRPESKPQDLVATLDVFATVLAHVVDGTPPGPRGRHPFGRADASGYAAMACDELLIHTADVGDAVDQAFIPSDELAAATLLRLFPWAPAETPPWQTLLWANDRTDLPGLPRQTGWKWHCDPLSEWDGTNPIRVSDPAGA